MVQREDEINNVEEFDPLLQSAEREDIDNVEEFGDKDGLDLFKPPLRPSVVEIDIENLPVREMKKFTIKFDSEFMLC